MRFISLVLRYMSPDLDAAEPLIIEAFKFQHFSTQHSLAI